MKRLSIGSIAQHRMALPMVTTLSTFTIGKGLIAFTVARMPVALLSFSPLISITMGRLPFGILIPSVEPTTNKLGSAKCPANQEDDGQQAEW